MWNKNNKTQNKTKTGGAKNEQKGPVGNALDLGDSTDPAGFWLQRNGGVGVSFQHLRSSLSLNSSLLFCLISFI